MEIAACYQLTLLLGRQEAESIADALGKLFLPSPDAVGFFESDTPGTCRVDAFFGEVPDGEALKKFLRDRGVDTDFTLARVPRTDWVAESQARLHPVRAGRFLIHGRHDRTFAAPRRWKIEVDAGQAFGSAHHGSTRGCLLVLDMLAKRETFRRILDIGTGTGILAIAAAKTWRAHIDAGDIDPLAIDIARTNSALNGAKGRVRLVAAKGLAHPVIRQGAPYDLVIANILARPLIAMAQAIAAAMQDGGAVILSGITSDQGARITAAYRAAGFVKDRRLSRIVLGEWVTLVLRKRTSAKTQVA